MRRIWSVPQKLDQKLIIITVYLPSMPKWKIRGRGIGEGGSAMKNKYADCYDCGGVVEEDVKPYDLRYKSRLMTKLVSKVA